MGAGIGILVTLDVPSLEGTGRIQASSARVLDDIGTWAPPSIEVLAASLSGRLVEGLACWAGTNCHGNSGRSL